MKFTGIGSRSLPMEYKFVLKKCGTLLKKMGYLCRTGTATGSDALFRELFKNEKLEVYGPEDAKEWCFKEILNHMPSDRMGFDTMKENTQKLLARNMMQILGENGDDPVQFVLCYAPSLNYKDSSSGGTGYAIRCALHHNIPVFNIFSDEDGKRFIKFLKDIKD